MNGLSVERSVRSLNNWYTEIQKTVSKFIVILKKVEDKRSFGFNEQDKLL